MFRRLLPGMFRASRQAPEIRPSKRWPAQTKQSGSQQATCIQCLFAHAEMSDFKKMSFPLISINSYSYIKFHVVGSLKHGEFAVKTWNTIRSHQTQMNGGIFLKERLSTRLNSHQSILWQTLLTLGIADVDRPVYLMYLVDSCCIPCDQKGVWIRHSD